MLNSADKDLEGHGTIIKYDPFVFASEFSKIELKKTVTNKSSEIF